MEGKQQARPRRTQLQNAGFNVTVSRTPSTQPAGTVVNQNPAGGTMVGPGPGHHLCLGRGKPIPLVGLSQQSAEASLQSAGFKANVQTVAGPAGTTPGNVWQQNPTANTTEAPGPR